MFILVKVRLQDKNLYTAFGVWESRTGVVT
jgi:hypothetical protein